jgi:hypothetical protein
MPHPKGYTQEQWNSMTSEEKKAHHNQKIKEWHINHRDIMLNSYTKYNLAHREQRAEYARNRYKKNRAIIEAYKAQQTAAVN